MPTNTKVSKQASNPSGYDITATVGRVEFGEGDEDGYLAAFRVIGEVSRELPMGGDRTFNFDPSGFEKDFVTVHVQFPGKPGDPDKPVDRWAEDEDRA